ncbi:MAG: DPP IV N-terminal domain-containing protein, partial [Gemmatimonadaceae bacterium]
MHLVVRRFRMSAMLLAACAAGGVSRIAAAQSPSARTPRVVTAADYQHAEQFLANNTARLVLHSDVRPTWIENDPDDRFWYRTRTERGEEFMLVDPAKKTRGAAFDQTKLAAAITAASGRQAEPYALPFMRFDFTDQRAAITFDLRGAHYTCTIVRYACNSAKAPDTRNEKLSPDGRKAVFIRDWNLWVRDVASGTETPLTTDGVTDFGYATDNAGWARSDRPIVLWSPDSKKVATFQQDQRRTGEMYLVSTQVGHPKLEAWKYPLPGDSTVTMIQRVIIDVDTPRVIRLQMPPDQHRSTLCDDVACRGDWSDVQWSPDATHLAFISTSRDHKHEVL